MRVTNSLLVTIGIAHSVSLQPLSTASPLNWASGSALFPHIFLPPLRRRVCVISCGASWRSLSYQKRCSTHAGKPSGKMTTWRTCSRFLALFAASGSLHSLDQQQYADLKRYLPDDILFKVVRMSMAVSLETRGPLMD